ncbi:hypothetical protein BHE74_00004256 [Ensete ventricosum]|uniref:Uncharacterized protein n=1 Tax=Ensete ventricosum TaxID=4639 RepID=A0A427B8D7_ENSVE|nr:hypothetical protein B296_00013677 [Ensete ventricosum]RWW34790.1 hypothetical protein GW17_00000431 [Ensete ventricosum]RWW86945.1 hypothetical protein BHE74_00004256 [Ensete ventricosum]RZR79559.1 hypothetical protein BHM03_00005303 [Ensete ventricosum]
MGVFTFVCRSSGGEWSAKQLSGDLEASAASTFDLQRRLVQEALAVDSTGGVQSSFSMVSPASAVFQVRGRSLFSPNVIIGGGGGGGAFIIGAPAPSGAAAGSGGGAAAPDAPPAAEEKKEEKEESDEDMGFSLFD